MKRYCIVFAATCLLLITASGLAAESSTAVTLDIYGAVIGSPGTGDDVRAVGSGSATLRYNATGNDNVRATLIMEAALGPVYTISVDRAFVRARFDNFRLTAGKTRLSWGEGSVFNAGDLVMGGTSLDSLDLFGEEARDDSLWLASLYLPLGRFSYLEAVALPGDISYSGSSVVLPGVQEASAGLRSAVRIPVLGGIQFQSGYLYDGSGDSHEGFASLQGGGIVNWHLSSSLSAVTGEWDSVGDSLQISSGVYQIIALDRIHQLSLRAEALYSQAGSWTEYGENSADGAALYLYGEAAFTAGAYTNTFLRSVINPVDSSAIITWGITFAPFQGYTLYSSAAIMAGDDDDTYGFERAYGIIWYAGVRIQY